MNSTMEEQDGMSPNQTNTTSAAVHLPAVHLPPLVAMVIYTCLQVPLASFGTIGNVVMLVVIAR